VPDSGGLVLLPYFDGERTPDLPLARGLLHGLSRPNATPATLARAAFEGMLCGLADGVDPLREQGLPVQRGLLIGGAAAAPAGAGGAGVGPGDLGRAGGVAGGGGVRARGRRPAGGLGALRCGRAAGVADSGAGPADRAAGDRRSRRLRPGPRWRRTVAVRSRA